MFRNDHKNRRILFGDRNCIHCKSRFITLYESWREFSPLYGKCNLSEEEKEVCQKKMLNYLEDHLPFVK